jgi:hypothetical protein
VEDTDMSDWRKSTYSNGGGNACVEVASADGVMVRDTANRGGSMLAVSAGAWQVFTSKIKNVLAGDPAGGEHPSAGKHSAHSRCVISYRAA